MRMKKYNVAIVGVTGAVGQILLQLLEQRHFPMNKVYALASARSAGQQIIFNGETLSVQDSATFDFSKADIALFSAGGAVSKALAPKAAAQQCIVIDNTSAFRMEPDVPLVVPEVNAQALRDYTRRMIIANPNCSTIQMVTALKPIYDAVGIARINVATYQSVSGSGARAIHLLREASQQFLQNGTVGESPYAKPIAFNVLPHIDVFEDNGYTREEMKMVLETQKIFSNPNIKVNPTAVRVPVFYGHAEAVHIETVEKITVSEVVRLLTKAKGVILCDDPANNDYPTPFTEAAGNDNVYVGRVRQDLSHPLGLNLWVVADNIRKGAALNALQIAEVLVNDYL